jgi:hypothetical protein
MAMNPAATLTICTGTGVGATELPPMAAHSPFLLLPHQGHACTIVKLS